MAPITDILREENGEIAAIEVSEAVPTHRKRVSYPPEAFYEKYSAFSLCRYAYLDQVPLLDEEIDKLLWESGIEKIVPKISVDNGNKSNYLQGEEVIVSVNAENPDTVEFYRNGELVSSHPVARKAVFPLNPEHSYYVAKLRDAGDSVEFCVNHADVSHVVHDGVITVHADPCDEKSRILYADFRVLGTQKDVASLVKYEVLTEEEKVNHAFSRPVPAEAKNFKVYYENVYSVWTHTMTRI